MNSLFTSIIESHAKEKEFDETLKEFFLSIEPVYKEGIFPDSLYRKLWNLTTLFLSLSIG
jgi:hypothetical protein